MANLFVVILRYDLKCCRRLITKIPWSRKMKLDGKNVAQRLHLESRHSKFGSYYRCAASISNLDQLSIRDLYNRRKILMRSDYWNIIIQESRNPPIQNQQ